MERERRATPEGKAKQREWYLKCASMPKHRMQNLIGKAKGRARRKWLVFYDGLALILKETPPTHCKCCQRKFDYSLGKGHNKGRSPSLDRVDNSDGYTLLNTAVICRRCNTLKGDATLAEL